MKTIPKNDQIRILQRIAKLAEDPRPASSKQLSSQQRYRVRQGNYRILYSIEDDRLTITVVKIGHRGDVYQSKK
ncbi:MAG: type II toxin-antitoxin system RelE/ParE family toxin [Verrucomicrobiales bacterium]|nr:type II toxin-antitoxin system RelE/ParE family toxin [Verrucomicrobiales bacterium]